MPLTLQLGNLPAPLLLASGLEIFLQNFLTGALRPGSSGPSNEILIFLWAPCLDGAKLFLCVCALRLCVNAFAGKALRRVHGDAEN